MSDEERAEKLFDEVSDWFAEEIGDALGDDEREDIVCEKAVERFAAAKRLVDPEGAFENVTHFFGADGIGYEKEREPALRRVKDLSPKDGLRISEKLGEIAMRLESDALEHDDA